MVNPFGKGHVVYVAGTWGDTAWQMRFPDYHRFIANTVAAFSRPRLKVEHVPGSVEVTLRRSLDRRLEVIHLVNFSGDMIRPMRSITPCRNIELTLKNAGRVTAVKGLVSGRCLTFEVRGRTLHLRVPRLKEYEIVAIETAAPNPRGP